MVLESIINIMVEKNAIQLATSHRLISFRIENMNGNTIYAHKTKSMDTTEVKKSDVSIC